MCLQLFNGIDNKKMFRSLQRVCSHSQGHKRLLGGRRGFSNKDMIQRTPEELQAIKQKFFRSIYDPDWTGPSPAFEDTSEVMVQHLRWIMANYDAYTDKRMLGTKDWNKVHADEDFVVLSSGMQEDPILNYGNKAALDLFELDWNSLTTMRSAETALEQDREERMAFLKEVNKHGFVSGYSGIRVSSTGRKFRVNNLACFKIESFAPMGLAACFRKSEIEYL